MINVVDFHSSRIDSDRPSLEKRVLRYQEDVIPFSSHAAPAHMMDDTDQLQVMLAQLQQERVRQKQHVDVVLQQVEALESEIQLHARAWADLDALNVTPLPNSRQKRRLRCLGFRATDECVPMGPRVPENDTSCSEIVPDNTAGYCEVEDLDSKERFRVMQRYCDSLLPGVRFRCIDAWDFGNFAPVSEEIIRNATSSEGRQVQHGSRSRPEARRGIVMVVYPKLTSSAYASIRLLRSYNCTLPIELWYHHDELTRYHPVLRAIVSELGPVETIRINDVKVSKFNTKVHAIYHSSFDEVLFLDADNLLVRDPTFLFDSPTFRATGALFWPDFWHPNHTIFNVQRHSLLWELIGMPFVSMFEQESGQVLVNRKASRVALALLLHYTFHAPNHFERLQLVYGDKDLFRLAWLKSNSTFAMNAFPPGVAGETRNGFFCGMTMGSCDQIRIS